VLDHEAPTTVAHLVHNAGKPALHLGYADACICLACHDLPRYHIAIVSSVWVKEKVTITLDRLNRAQRMRDDIAAYRRVPPSDSEVAIGQLVENAALDDDTDWESVYAEDVT
jgi:hypothetical protein